MGQRLGGAGVLAVAVATATILTTINVMLGPTANAPVAAPATPVQPAAPAPAPPFAFTFSGYQVDNYRVLPPDEVGLVDQRAVVVRESATGQARQYVGTLTVYRPGMFDPHEFQTTAPLVVSGRDAYQASVPGPVILRTGLAAPTGFVVEPAAGASTVGTDLAVLAWQYADNSWAVLANEPFAEPIPLADQVRIAEGFAGAVSAPSMAVVPFQAGYLPAGFTLQSISGQSLVAEHRGIVTFVYGPPAATGEPTADQDQGPAPRVEISILWVDVPPPDAVERTSRCNPGQAWCATTLPGGEFYVAVEDPSKSLSDAQLLRISDGLIFADLKDSATWYSAV
jgi:hypothetical protein